MNPIKANARAVLIAAAQVLLPPPSLTVSQWADTYRVLSREDSAAPGQWDTSTRPYQRGIMDALSDPRVEFVSVQGSAQWGKTQILGNIVGYFAHLDASPIMVVQPTIQAAEKWSKTRLAPMIRDTPVLAGLISEAKSRDSGNTILDKAFPGGLLAIVGSNAPTGLASQPIRVLLLDEVDRFEASAGTEGDPVDLAVTRTLDFKGRRKIYACSTPGTKGDSRIEKAMAESDQRRFHVPCPHCSHLQHLKWSNVIWPEGQPLEAYYACEGSGCVITEPQLRRAIRYAEANGGGWIATRPEIKRHAGFYINGIYVRSLGELAEEFLTAKAKGPKSLQVFINTRLGELWNPRDGDVLQLEGLMRRRETYAAPVPAGVALLTAGVDIQDDRIEATIKGWGAGEESWLIVHRTIYGNLAIKEPWDELELLLTSPWTHELGLDLRIRAAAVDIGGHFTKQVYAFCRRPRALGLAHPIKGAAQRQAKVVQRSGKKTRLFLVDPNAMKDTVFARLKVDSPGPGFMHFPQETGPDYFEQLTSERPVRTSTGQRVYRPITEGARNEALDCEVYASAALEIFNPRDLVAFHEALEKASKPRETEEKEPETKPEIARTSPVLNPTSRKSQLPRANQPWFRRK